MPEQILAKYFAPFQLGRILVRPKNAQLFRLKRIDNSRHQGCFRADDGQAHIVLFGKADEPREIGGR